MQGHQTKKTHGTMSLYYDLLHWVLDRMGIDEGDLQVMDVEMIKENFPLHSYGLYILRARGRGGKEKEWTDCVQSDIRAFGITGEWKAMVLKAEVWVEVVTEGGRRLMAAWRKEEEDAARHRQEKREATRLGKLLSHTEA